MGYLERGIFQGVPFLITMNNEIYFKATYNAEPNILLQEAVLACPGGNALDLGAGALNDSIFMLGKGFTVTAVDSSPLTLEKSKQITDPHFTMIGSSFDTFNFPEKTFDIISAQWSLSFNPPETFNTMFESLKKSLKEGGIFCGHFYGIKDGWSDTKNMTFFSLEDVKNLLAGFNIIKLFEEEENVSSVEGGKKHWHVFHVIASK